MTDIMQTLAVLQPEVFWSIIVLSGLLAGLSGWTFGFGYGIGKRDKSLAEERNHVT